MQKRKRQNAEPCESDKLSEKAAAESPYEKQKEEAKLGRSLRKRSLISIFFVKNRQNIFAIE